MGAIAKKEHKKAADACNAITDLKPCLAVSSMVVSHSMYFLVYLLLFSPRLSKNLYTKKAHQGTSKNARCFRLSC